MHKFSDFQRNIIVKAFQLEIELIKTDSWESNKYMLAMKHMKQGAEMMEAVNQLIDTLYAEK